MIGRGRAPSTGRHPFPIISRPRTWKFGVWCHKTEPRCHAVGMCTQPRERASERLRRRLCWSSSSARQKNPVSLFSAELTSPRFCFHPANQAPVLVRGLPDVSPQPRPGTARDRAPGGGEWMLVCRAGLGEVKCAAPQGGCARPSGSRRTGRRGDGISALQGGRRGPLCVQNVDPQLTISLSLAGARGSLIRSTARHYHPRCRPCCRPSAIRSGRGAGARGACNVPASRLLLT